MCGGGGGGGGGGGWQAASDGALENMEMPDQAAFRQTDDGGQWIREHTELDGYQEPKYVIDQARYDMAMGEYNSAQAEKQRRADLRAQIAAQEKAMRETQAQIQQNLVDAQAKQVQQEAAQRKQVAELQAQQVQRTGEIKASGQAVASSLQILGDSVRNQGPTAAMAPKVKGRVSASSSNPTGLRIGSTMTGSGVGTNLGT